MYFANIELICFYVCSACSFHFKNLVCSIPCLQLTGHVYLKQARPIDHPPSQFAWVSVVIEAFV